MTTDPTIREQGYQYFLQEAPELLHVLEQGLLSLREDCSLNKVNTLMRATHTLKGAAASVGLETISTVAHSLEDVLNAICKPDVVIDSEAEALLFEGFECLRLPLTAEFTGGTCNHAEILDRTATVFAQLQEKLGDYFSRESHLPTSTELGFDITQSIFEVGVTQRLDQIAAVLEQGQPAEIRLTLQTQSEIFLGLAESLNLPRFGAIAQLVLTALEQSPDQEAIIAQQALQEFRAAQAVILAGDRSQTGQASDVLQQLANLADPALDRLSPVTEIANVSNVSNITDITNLTNITDTTDVIDIINSEPSISPENQGADQAARQSFFDSIWGGKAVSSTSNSATPDVTPDVTHSVIQDVTQDITSDLTSDLSVEPTVLKALPSEESTHTHSRGMAPAPTLRVNVEHLDQLNYLVEELLIGQNRQSLQDEQVQAAIKVLYTRLEQHRQLLYQLQELRDRSSLSEQSQTARNLGQGDKKKQRPPLQLLKSLLHNHFDPLELDRYNETQLIAQSLLDDAVQLTEAIDAIDLFTRQFGQTQAKQQRLLTSARDALMSARMMPLGDILNRFPAVLQQLARLHNKPVALNLKGIDILVDKVIAEQLHAPLLHLVRNAFDHGIENVETRRQRGKPEQGQLEIYAYNQGRYLMIEVRDDGDGLDFEQIRQQAIERHLISPEQIDQMNSGQLTELLFESGFSTAVHVNDLSGRGIGLNVVRNQIQALQGTVTVVSEPGQGTVFTLEVPLSLTVAKLFLCQSDSKTYALFADAVEQVLIPQPDQIQVRKRGNVLRWGEGADRQWVPIYPMAKALIYQGLIAQIPIQADSVQVSPVQTGYAAKPEPRIILIRHQGSLVGLEVDHLLEEQELVIRPLGALIKAPSYVYGISILAEGRLALVVDAATLVTELFTRQSNSSIGNAFNSSSLPSSPEQWQLATSQSLPILSGSKPPQESGQRVLIVEDSITTRRTLSLTLQKAGYQVLQAKDGYEAIEQLHCHPDIQVVLCDIEMPRMNGFEFLKHRQQDPVIVNIPVITLTSRSGEKHRRLAEHLGAAAYITKPYLEQKLLEIVAKVCEMHTLNSGRC